MMDIVNLSQARVVPDRPIPSTSSEISTADRCTASACPIRWTANPGVQRSGLILSKMPKIARCDDAHANDSRPDPGRYAGTSPTRRSTCRAPNRRGRTTIADISSAHHGYGQWSVGPPGGLIAKALALTRGDGRFRSPAQIDAAFNFQSYSKLIIDERTVDRQPLP